MILNDKEISKMKLSNGTLFETCSIDCCTDEFLTYYSYKSLSDWIIFRLKRHFTIKRSVSKKYEIVQIWNERYIARIQ